MVTAATIYLSLLGLRGLRNVALTAQARTADLVLQLSEIAGVDRLFSGAHFHEACLRLDRPVAAVLEALAAVDIFGGFDLSEEFPQLGNALLVCATETKTEADLQAYASALSEVMATAAPKSA